MTRSSKSALDLSAKKRSLLKLLREREGLATGSGEEITRRTDGGLAPPSFSQQRLWFVDQLEPGNPVYNFPGAVRLRGALDTDSLRGALTEILNRHESLRTRFVLVGGEPMQEVLPPREFPLREVDLGDLPEPCRSRRTGALVSEEARLPFDLSAGPLARALLVRCEEEEHVLVVTMHHIATDGWSVGLVMKELSALYQAFRRNEPSPLPPLPIQYADFARWQRERLTGDVLARHLEFWKKTLGSDAPFLELPTDRPRPARRSFRGGRVDLRLSSETSSSIRSLARENGATVHMVLLAAFDVLLARHSGQDEIVVGTSIANRNRREVEPLIGFFVNTLAMRVDLRGDPTFLELLERVRKQVLEADHHQDLPFERLVEEIAPERDPGRNPFFEVVFDLQRAPRESFTLEGLTLHPFEFETGTTRFDIELHLVEGAEEIRGFLRYDPDLFEEETIRRIARRYETLLRAVSERSETRIGELPIADDQELREIASWNDTTRAYPETCVHELFGERAAEAPDAPAVVCGGESLSYGELERRSNRLARYLRTKASVARGDRVAIGLDRSPEMVVALLATLKAGAAYVPLDPSYPEERLRFMLSDAKPTVVLTTEALLERLPAEKAHSICLDREREAVERESEEAFSAGATSDELAYVTYTSGSTGRPKGVEVTHRGVVRLLFGVDYVRLGPEETILQLAPGPFDASTFEIWGALLHGGRLVLYPGAVPETAPLGELLRREGVTTLWLTASLFNAIVDEAPSILSPVKQLLVGGEALSPAHIRRALEALPDVEIVNGYGPTEGTTFTCCYRIPRSDEILEGRVRSVPIGRPIANTRVHLLDEARKPVPIGVLGELYIGGDGLARGYLERPELTAEAFVPHPFAEVAGERLYRTGDRARYLANGDIEFLGRSDAQVKVRGFRIELQEIESALREHPAVDEAAVVVREGADADKSLVAHVVSARGADGPSALELRAFLGGKLPEYMVPNAFVPREALPLSPSGKVDRRALALLEPSTGRAGADLSPPRGPVEEALAEIWSRVLERDGIGIHESFFALGGHSLAAVKVLARIRQSFQVDVPLRALFEGPTVAELGRKVEEAMAAHSGSELPELQATAPSEFRELSSAQRRLWLMERLSPESASYNVGAALRLRGALDAEALEQALAAIVDRHEALRVSVDEDGRHARIAPAGAFRLERIDLSESADPEAEALRRGESLSRMPFDLARGPLFRCDLMRLGADDHVLLWTMHHIATDAWSIGIFYRELEALYRARHLREDVSLPAIRIQYGDFAKWQNQCASGERLAQNLDYWRDVLGDAPPPTELPADRLRPTRRSYEGARLSRRLASHLSERIAELGVRHGVTAFMTLLAAFDLLIARYSGTDDVVVGTPVANRSREEIEGTIGLFVNTLVMRSDLSGDPTFAELLSRVRRTTLGAFAHQDLPFDRLVAELKPDRHTDRNPIFQVAFALQSAPVAPTGGVTLEGLEVRPLELSLRSSRFDFELHVWERGSEMGLVASYDSESFEEATVARLLAHYETLLERALAHPDAKLSRLSPLGESERASILEWSRVETDYPRDETIPAIFAARVAETPQSIAMVFGDQELSYRELDRRSTMLARRLAARGVRAESLVGLLGERSIELYVSALAVLKAGGAYVPLDPSYPVDRLRFMIEDAGLAALIVDRGAAGLLPKTDLPVLYWDEPVQNIELDAEPPDLAPRLSPDSLAYVIYTSGSTGVPKGVGVTHRAVLRLVLDTNYIVLSREDRVAQAASFSFDAATFELWGGLLSGARVVGLRKDVALAPQELGRELVEQRVSVLFLTTALFNLMVREARDALRGIRCLLFGGEAVDAASVRALLSSGGPERLLHVYGPTESTTFASASEVRALPDGARTVPIGGPIANTELCVVDPDFELAPIGVCGELLIGGDGLARGYWNRPDLTADRFVPHPFRGEGARLYRTGDVVRWLSGGELEFVGRRDGQVKLRGFRVELGEVESALRCDPRVADALAMVREDRPGDKRLVAYVVFGEGSNGTVAELRRDLGERLPEYMVPQSFVSLLSLPLTPNGKIDRAALPPPDTRSASEDDFTPPRGPLEEELATLARELLGIDRISVHDDFFHLGGHSLLATELVSRVRKIFAVEIPLRAFFASPTIASLAKIIEERERSGDGERELEGFEIRRLPRDGELLPLSFAQQRLWFLSQLDPESEGAYNIATAVRLEGELFEDALTRSLEILVDRHESLRSVFVDVDGSPRVRVLAPGSFRVSRADLERLSPPDREKEVQAFVALEARRPFDASRGPLFRCHLLRLGARDHVFQVVMDHRVADGWSLGVLFRELGALYRDQVEGRPSTLPELPIQYADFAAWQRGWLQGSVLERQLDYWRERLSGDLPLLELPTDFPRPAVRTSRGGRLSRRLGPGLARRLSELARRENVTLFMAVLAGFEAFLGRYSGQSEVVIGTQIANRNRVEVEPLIGFFVNNLVLRCDLAGDPTFVELLSRVRDMTLGAYAHQDLPFELLVEELQPERDLSQNPLFRVAFAFQSARIDLELQGLRWRRVDQDIRTTRFDLELHVWETAAGLELITFYSADLWSRPSVERMLERFERLLEGATNEPSARLSELPLLSGVEVAKLLTLWGPPVKEIAKSTTIHELFEARAKEQPDAVALVLGSEDRPRWTYRELDERANQVAHHLRSLGIGPESRVGICLERSLTLVAAILAVLKAGGAYVPLDPSYPGDRIAYVLRDSAAAAVVSDSRSAGNLPEMGPSLVLLDRDEAEIARCSRRSPQPRASASSLAYVIYTSGSTGRPKGVGVEHRNVVRLLERTFGWFHFDEKDVWTLFHSYAFDFSVWELWGALAYGGRLVVVPYEVSRSPESFLGLLVSEKVTVLNQTPSAFRQLIEADSERNLEEPLHLRVVIFGGEALDIPALRPWFERHGDERPTLVNMYGITETTVHVTYRPVRLEDCDSRASVIGRPIDDLTLYVLDSGLNPVPLGAAGELYVGGPGLSRGYLGRPELTAERFVPDPFGTESTGARLYRTGDRARVVTNGPNRPNWDVEYLGRADQQVKIRGFRIELGEIESLLAQHEAVQEALVVLREDRPGDQRLAAYVVPHRGHAFAVRKWLELERTGALEGRRAYELPDGAAIVHHNKSETDFMYDEIFVKRSYLKHGIQLGESATVFDVGANIGMFTLFVSRVAPKARVFAFEPLPPLFDTLSRNAALSGLDVALFPYGLSDRERRETFRFYPHATVLSSRHADLAAETETVRTFLRTSSQSREPEESLDELLADRLETEDYACELRTLSDVIREQGVEHIDLLKIDAEKSELEVLEGIEERDWGKIDQLVVEVHDVDGRLARIDSWLRSLGYATEVEQDETLVATPLYNLYARRKEPRVSREASPAVEANGCFRSPARLVAELRQFLIERLPEYMVPSALVLLDAVPLTPQGKIDKRALPAPAEAVEREGSLDVKDEPRTPVEAALVSIYEDVLGRARISVHDDFFELGGHSLLATQLVSRIRKAFAIELPLRVIFEAPTVAELATKLPAREESSEGPSEGIIEAAGQDGELELSFSQQRLWFFDQLDPGSSAYNMPFAIEMHGSLDDVVLERSLLAIIERHSVLRSVFESADGKPRVRLLSLDRFRLRRVDLSALDPSRRRAEAARLAEVEARRPFSLGRDPLVRLALVELAREEHLFLLTIHHIVGDGWSLVVLFQELDELSRAFASGKPSPLPALTIQYSDFARWQRDWLRGGVLDQQLQYWKKTLEGAPAHITLPTDWQRPAVQTFRGGKASRKLPAELQRALRELSHREGATTFMTLLAAFQALLSRLSGQRDIVLGTPIAGRNRKEIEPLIGFFVNTLVLRTSLEGNPTFRELLRRARETSFGAFANQDLPFDKLVEELAPERDLSRTPLFQVMFNFLNLGGTRMTLSSVSVEAAPYVEPESKFDLTLYAGEQEETLQLTLVYNADLFQRSRVETMLSQLEAILTAAASDPDVPLAAISLVTPDQREFLPEPDEPLSVTSGRAPHERFSDWALRAPERIAVADERHEWSYGELERAANGLARRLLDCGVGEGDVVAVYAARSASLVWAFLGIWKAGAAFVVLDSAYPQAHLNEVLRQARPRAAVLLRAAGPPERELKGAFEALELTLELPESLDRVDGPGVALLESSSSGPQDDPTPPERRAYLCFTSGSTGSPRGIVGIHRPLAHFLEWHAGHFGFDASDRFAMLAGLSYDPLLRDVFTPLVLGARLDVPSSETLRQGRLAAWLRASGTTIVHITPSLAKLLEAGGEEAPVLPSLRRVFIGGEPLFGRDVARLRARAPSASIVNYYGTTETPQAMGYFEVPSDKKLDERERLPIGKGIPDVQLLVLAESGRLAGIGELGEICVRTPYLSAGYLNDPELTRRRFPVLPFTREDASGVYRTGDLGRYLPDGSVDFVGRADQQIKLRGHRIELADVETALQRHQKARDSVVVCREEGGEEPQLVAYIARETDDVSEDALARELEKHLSRLLPEHMRPGQFVFLEALPLTPNGKVNRRALPAPGNARLEREFVAPRTPIEEAVAEIWLGLLPVKRVSIRDNFFRLGGHSLLATQVVARIRDSLDVEVPLRRIFEGPTIEDLAIAVTEALVASIDGMEGTDGEEMAAAILSEVSELDGSESPESTRGSLAEMRAEGEDSERGA